MMIWGYFLLFMEVFVGNANALHLKSGDIILQPTSCYLCRLIEAEEKTKYSHMGILVLNGNTWNVLEAWGKVRMSTLEDFLSRKKENSQSLVIRANKQSLANPLNANKMNLRFNKQFNGLSYDSEFLWSNSNTDGEKLYCSEFVAKFIQPYLAVKLLTKPMHYEVNREYWIKYFHGNPPDGAPGISPGDFERSPLFHNVGYL